MFIFPSPWNLFNEIGRARDAADLQKEIQSKSANISKQRPGSSDPASEELKSQRKIDVQDILSQSFLQDTSKKYLTIHHIPFAQSTKTIIKIKACTSSILRSEDICKLKQLGIPLKEDLLQDIYNQINEKSAHLFDNPLINYPALFSIELNSSHTSKPRSIKSLPRFFLEIHATRDIFLLIRDHQQTNISQGSAKRVIKAFRLNTPQIYAYALSRKQEKTHEQRNEERFLSLFATSSRIVKVASLHYYDQRQAILMHYYPQDFLGILSKLLRGKIQITNEVKRHYSLQLLEGIQEIHQKNVVHRDLKPSNILVKKDGKTIQITDFGLSGHDTREELKGLAGTLGFLAPEAWNGQIDTFGKPLDIWSAGCLFWILWKEECYSWYRYNWFDQNSIQFVSYAIDLFHRDQPSPNEHLDILIWHMLHPIPQQRWPVEQCLAYFNKHGEKF